jgi:limonene-1,2-epoxide hydrolase
VPRELPDLPPPTSPLDVVERYLDALTRRDYTAARRCLANSHFRYRSPIGSFDSADDFVAELWRLGSIMEGITICAACTSGKDVCHVYELRTRWSELVVTRIAQWSRVEDGRICEIEAFFDAQRYAELFEH